MMSVTNKTSYSVCSQMHYKDLCSSVSNRSSKFFYFNETAIQLISLLLDFQNTIPHSRLLKPNNLYSFQIRKRRNLSTFIMWCLFFKLRVQCKNDAVSPGSIPHTFPHYTDTTAALPFSSLKVLSISQLGQNCRIVFFPSLLTVRTSHWMFCGRGLGAAEIFVLCKINQCAKDKGKSTQFGMTAVGRGKQTHQGARSCSQDIPVVTSKHKLARLLH